MADRRVLWHFTDDERRRAIDVGDRRADFHEQRGTPGAYGLRVDRAEARRISRVGALAELAVATHLGVADSWVEFTEDYHALTGDVMDGVEVRSTRARLGGVLLHPRDHNDRIYVGVRTGNANRGYVELVGWVYGIEGKRSRWWPGKYPERPCFMIPPDALRSMEGLEDAIADRKC